MIEKITFSKKSKFFLQRSISKYRNLFSPILLIPFILVIISGVLIHSIQRQSIQTDSYSHILTGFVGYLLAIIISYTPLDRIKKFVIPIYSISLFFLILVYFFGLSIYGAQRWLDFRLFSFQPSEVAKLATLLALSFSLDSKIINSIKDLFFPLLIVSLPWALIFLQPDLGTSLVLIFMVFVMLYWAQMPIEWILILGLSIFTAIFSFVFYPILFVWIPIMGYLAYKSFKKKKTFFIISISFHALIAKLTPLFWNIGLKEYQRNRLILFLDPARDPLGGGYHLIQSKIAIGSGGAFGTGLLNGKLTNLQFIPEQHTDFIFSALGEELGFIGSLFVLILFFILIMKLINISKNARTDFESLVVIGIASIFLFQIIINIYMTIGLGPVTGIPLPFMSYGRTSLLVNFSFIGFALSTLKRSRKLRKL